LGAQGSGLICRWEALEWPETNEGGVMSPKWLSPVLASLVLVLLPNQGWAQVGDRTHLAKRAQRFVSFDYTIIIVGSFLPSPLLVGTTKFTRAWEPTLLWNHFTS